VEHANRKFVVQFRVPLSTLQSILPANNQRISSLSIEENSQSSSTAPPPPPSSAEYISVETAPMLVIHRRFSIQLDPHNNNNSSIGGGGEDNYDNPNPNPSEGTTFVWYKDEGGKDHGIELLISVVDKDNNYCSSSGSGTTEGEGIPFLLTLHYQNQLETTLSPSSGLYSLLPDNNNNNNNSNSNNVIDRHSGRCLKKLRIHDISKNHQRRLFVIRVAPDLSKNPSKYIDIASDVSNPIEVRSKRSKKSRDSKGMTGGLASGHSNNELINPSLNDYSTNPSSLPIITTNNNNNNEEQPDQQLFSSASSAASLLIKRSLSTQNMNNLINDNKRGPDSKKTKYNNGGNISHAGSFPFLSHSFLHFSFLSFSLSLFLSFSLSLFLSFSCVQIIPYRMTWLVCLSSLSGSREPFLNCKSFAGNHLVIINRTNQTIAMNHSMRSLIRMKPSTVFSRNIRRK
jgi:hypothetical protein